MSDIATNMIAQAAGFPWAGLAPAIIMAVAAMLLMAATSVVRALRTNDFAAGFTFTASAVSAVTGFIQYAEHSQPDTPPAATLANTIAVDGFSLGVVALTSVLLACSALFMRDYFANRPGPAAEPYGLVMLSLVGAQIMILADNLVLLFVGLELMSLASYVLATYLNPKGMTLEAAFKYFVMGAIASAVFAIGMAFVFGATGSVDYIEMVTPSINSLGYSANTHPSMMLVGIGLVLSAALFKVGVVPFWNWVPDVYQMAPTPIVGFMASVVKIAAVVAVARVSLRAFSGFFLDFGSVLAFLAVVSIIVGSVLSLVQHDVKRFLAYSSISHAGFMVLALSQINGLDRTLSSQSAALALAVYLVAYGLMAVGSFGCVAATGNDSPSLSELSYCNHPVAMALLVLFLFAQAGVPFTIGFFAKFSVIAGAVEADSYWLAALAMLGAVIGAAAYLRVITAIFSGSGDSTSLAGSFAERPVTLAVTVVIGVAVVALGVLPNILTDRLTVATEDLLVYPDSDPSHTGHNH